MREPRNPARIDVVLDVIRAYWKRHPGLRLCQIIGNANGEYHTEDHDLLDAMGAYADHFECNMVRRDEWCDCPRRQP